MKDKLNKLIIYFKTLDQKKVALYSVALASVIVIVICGIVLPKMIKDPAKSAQKNVTVSTSTTNQESVLLFSEINPNGSLSSVEETTQTPSVVDIKNLKVQDADPREDGQYMPAMGADVIIAPRKIGNVPQRFSAITPMAFSANNSEKTTTTLPSTESTTTSTTENSTTSTTASTTESTTTTTTSPTTTEETTTQSPAQGTKVVPKGALNNWQRAYDNIYYFDSNHNPLKGMQTVDTVKYRFNQYGAEASKIAIDVSSHNAYINWAQVKAAGVDYAIIRVGYRGYRNPSLNRDTMADRNIQGALANGIKVGLYFYSQAITNEEAIEEASLSIDYAKRYKITLPIYFDTEYSEADGAPGRADLLNRNQRTLLAQTFCNTVRGAGYQAGIYASKAFFYDDLNMNSLLQYHIWLAHYTSSDTDFKYQYSLWQYSARGGVQGVSGYVDVNICLYDFEKRNDMMTQGDNIEFV